MHRPEDAPIILVRGVGDIGSAVAHRLFREGYGVVIHDDPKPTMTRRGMAFADAAFDGHAVLDGVRAVVAAHETCDHSERRDGDPGSLDTDLLARGMHAHARPRAPDTAHLRCGLGDSGWTTA